MTSALGQKQVRFGPKADIVEYRSNVLAEVNVRTALDGAAQVPRVEPRT